MLYSFFMPAAKMKERLALPYVKFVVQDILLFLHLLTFTCVHFYLITARQSALGQILLF